MKLTDIQACNQRVARRELRYCDGTFVQKELELALVSKSGSFAYRVEDGIFILLKQKAIELSEKEHGKARTDNTRVRLDVQEFYEQTGWKKSAGGAFHDTELFEDLRPVSKEYITKSYLRVPKHLSPNGRYFLDVASGPIPHEEYLDYSTSYDYRICVDLSLLALQQAKEKLGNRGVYLLSDILDLPLNDNSVDAAVSLHTIYHVPAQEQASAFREVCRVLNQDRSAVIVYSWGEKSLIMNVALLPLHILRYFPSTMKTFLKRFAIEHQYVSEATLSKGNTPILYAHYHPYKWFQRQQWNFRMNTLVWRSVNLPFLKYYVHSRFLGKQMLSLVFRLEEYFPHFFGRFGQYPMFIILK